MQVASRLLLVWGVVDQFPHLAKSAGYSTMLVAWSVTEVVRYSYFVFNLSGYQPAFITWLRYNLFFVLYPMGISSECWMMYTAIKPAKKVRMEFAWFLQLMLFVYIPGKPVDLCSILYLIIVRLVHPLHAHDGTAKKDHERKADSEDAMSGSSRRDAVEECQAETMKSRYGAYDFENY